MKVQPSIKKNYLYNIFYQVLTFITPLITAPYISRVLGADKIGIHSYTNSIVYYFTLFAAMGTVQYGQREIAMHRDNRYESSKLFWEIESVSIVTTIFTIIAWSGWILLSTKYTVYYAVLAINIISVAFDVSWYFSGNELFKYIVLRNSIVKITGIILIFALVHSPDDLLLYMLIMSVSVLFGNISIWTYLPKRLQRVSRSEIQPVRHVKQIITYFIPTIAISIYAVLDKTMIGVITGNESENGYYEQASRVISTANSIVFSLNGVMTTRMSYLYSERRIEEMKDKIRKSFDYLLFISIGIFFGLIGISKNFVPWFFGTGYDRVIKLLYYMSPLPFIICISNILDSQYLVPSGQRSRSTKGIIVGAVVNLICNSILIPKYGSVGAIMGSVIAESVISVIFVHMSRKCIAWKDIGCYIWKRIIAGGIMLFVVLIIGYYNSENICTTALQIVIGVMTYSFSLFIMNDSFINWLKGYLKNKIMGRKV